MRKLVRYAAVSAVASTVSLTILGILVGTSTLSPGWANIVATAVGTIPSFELNRRWVWGKAGRRSFSAEIGPYCGLSFSGLALSTIAVSLASRWATVAGFSVGTRTLVAEGANVATFGTLWLMQYALADRFLFRAGAAVGVEGEEGCVIVPAA